MQMFFQHSAPLLNRCMQPLGGTAKSLAFLVMVLVRLQLP